MHGAGRVMSRSQAAGRVRRQAVGVPEPRLRPGLRVENTVPGPPGRGLTDGSSSQAGLVDWPAVQRRLREQGIVLVGGGADEAPEVYKRLPEVLARARRLRPREAPLRPLGVAMAGRDVRDPYKD